MEAALALLALAFFLLPIIALVTASSTRTTLLKRIKALEEEVGSLRTAIVTLTAAVPSPAQHPAAPVHTAAPEPSAGPAIIPAQPITPATSPGRETMPTPLPQTLSQHPATAEQKEIRTSPAGNAPAESIPAGSIPADGARTATSRPRPQPIPAAKAPKPARTNAEWEALLGGRVLNRIGALALIIGFGFFLKYAFDQEWITEGMQTAIGGIVGVALLLIGARSHKKGYEVFSQGLVGTGIAVLYLTIFAAFSLYDIGLSQIPAFILMGVVTIIAFQQAFYYNSLAVSLLGLIGGFLTPMMLSTGTVRPAGLFTYLAILNVGIIAISVIKTAWKPLEPLAMAATYLYFMSWLNLYAMPAQAGTAAIFLGIFWLIFQAHDIYRTIRGEKASGLIVAIGALNAGVLLLNMIQIADLGGRIGESIPAAAIGAIYILLALLLRRPGHSDTRVDSRNAIVGITALTIAVWLHTFAGPEYYYASMVLSALATALFFWGTRANFPAVWVPALLILFNAFLFSVMIAQGAPLVVIGAVPVHAMMVAHLVLAAALFIFTRLAQRLDGKRSGTVATALEFGLGAMIFIMASIATGYTYQYQIAPADVLGGTAPEMFMLETETQQFNLTMILILVWLAYTLLITWIGKRTGRNTLVLCGVGALAIALLTGITEGASYVPEIGFRTILNIRALVFVALILTTALLARWLHQGSRTPGTRVRPHDILQLAVILLIFELLTVEVSDTFSQKIALLSSTHTAETIDYAGVQALRNWEQLAISSAWLLYATILMVLGIARRLRSLRVIAFSLFGLAILKIFIYDLSFLDTLYRIFSFIGLGVILLVISFLFQRYRTIIFGTDTDADAGIITESSDQGRTPEITSKPPLAGEPPPTGPHQDRSDIS